MAETSPPPASLTELADWHSAAALRADDRGDERTRDFHIGAAEVANRSLKALQTARLTLLNAKATFGIDLASSDAMDEIQAALSKAEA